ncbi:hypothetical protein Shyhy02_08940 [Streptomyces hygroscopicus subsp. hygroscopicus]|nr:hypothetical protein Shyhy02_08940 [Streptomyces hygroscopicus subsp. hygroscopicus]
MDSKSGVPAGISLQPDTWASETASWRRDADCALWRSRSQSPVFRSASTRTRVGRVLMNIPTIDSTPASSAGRPETVVPKTTSRSPLYRDSSSAQAPCTTVLTVSPPPRAVSRSRRDTSALSDTATVAEDRARWDSTARRSRGSGVGAVKPASRSRQWRSASCPSCSASQRR